MFKSFMVVILLFHHLAMKCNPDCITMDLVSTLPGACVDCASPEEIEICLDRNISPRRIIYANPTKVNIVEGVNTQSEECILYAAEKGVWCGTLDCVDEVEKIYSVLGERASNCRIVLRLWVDDSHSKCPLSSKFGCMESEIEGIMEACKNHNMQVVGVAFHVGSGSSDNTAYSKAIANAKKAFDIGKKHGFEMNLLDFGGGWPGTLADKDYHNAWLEGASKDIDASLKEHGFDNIENIKYMSEPGRYFNNLTIDVACYVINVQERDGVMIYRINEGVDGIFKDHKLTDELTFDVETWAEGECYKTVFVGPSGKSYDVIDHLGSEGNHRDIMLPRLKVGDPVLFRNIGSYTVSLSNILLREHQQHCYLIRESSLSSIQLFCLL